MGKCMWTCGFYRKGSCGGGSSTCCSNWYEGHWWISIGKYYSFCAKIFLFFRVLFATASPPCISWSGAAFSSGPHHEDHFVLWDNWQLVRHLSCLGLLWKMLLLSFVTNTETSGILLRVWLQSVWRACCTIHSASWNGSFSLHASIARPSLTWRNSSHKSWKLQGWFNR